MALAPQVHTGQPTKAPAVRGPRGEDVAEETVSQPQAWSHQIHSCPFFLDLNHTNLIFAQNSTVPRLELASPLFLHTALVTSLLSAPLWSLHLSRVLSGDDHHPYCYLLASMCQALFHTPPVSEKCTRVVPISQMQKLSPSKVKKTLHLKLTLYYLALK